MSRPTLSLLVVLTALLVGLGVATQAPPASPAGPTAASKVTRFVPVARTAVACPDPVVDATSVTQVSMAAPGAIDDRAPDRSSTSSGSATLRPQGKKPGPATARLTARGSVVSVLPAAGSTPAPAPADGGTPAGGGALIGTATRALAPGFAASMLTRSTTDDLRGLSGTACAPPGTSFWFVGSGAIVGQRGRVYLTNTESVPAVVDLTLYGPTGPIEAPSGRGVTIAAGAQEVLKLDALAPDVTRFGIHVQVRQGRVSAAVRDQQVSGLTPRGADWVPAAVAPRRRLVLPGVAVGSGERRLQVLVPGDSDAIVKVRLMGASGGFVPAGLDVVEARAGRVTEIDLEPYTGTSPVAVSLTADQPVTAGLLYRVQGAAGEGTLTDFAYTAAAPALTASAPGVVPELRGTDAGPTVHARVLLAAPGEAVRLQIDVLPPATDPTRSVRIPAGSQVTVDAADLSTAKDFAVSLRPLSGSDPVMASSEISESDTSGPMVTSSVVVPARYAVRVPSVVADLSTGLRSGEG
jgi:uncharacterized protein DUF5719